MKKFLYFFGFGLIFIIFWLVAYVALDPDFGWHIRMGDIITTSGLPKTDPFSYTMPSYPYIDHEWLSHVIWYYLYLSVGRAGMALLYTGIALGALVVVLPSNLRRFGLIPLLLTVGVAMSRFGIRVQVVSWLFTALVVKILLTEDAWKKYGWSLPLLMLFWANMHGSFLIGVSVLWIFLGFRLLDKRLEKRDFLIGFTSTAVTFFNPYGVQLWWEIYHQASSVLNRTTIVEWQPFYSKVEFSFWMLAVIALVFGTRYRRHLPRWLMAASSLLFFMSLTSVRHMVLFAIVVIPLITFSLGELYHEVRRRRWGLVRVNSFVRILTYLACFITVTDVVPTAWGWLKWSEAQSYPVAATHYLKQLPNDGEVFALYAWGGYLDWKLPERKVFIDGRMPTFRWQAPKGEGDNAYAEYLQVVQGQNVDAIFNKYNVRYVLWYQIPSTVQINGITHLKERLKELFGHNQINSRDLLMIIKSMGWQQIYQDEVAVIYSR